jgi:hypothetical protein
MNDLTAAVVTIATAIVGVALLAVLVSKNANTSGVLNAAGSAFSTALGAATGPVTGNTAMGGTGFSLPSLNIGTGSIGGF